MAIGPLAISIRCAEAAAPALWRPTIPRPRRAEVKRESFPDDRLASRLWAAPATLGEASRPPNSGRRRPFPIYSARWSLSQFPPKPLPRSRRRCRTDRRLRLDLIVIRDQSAAGKFEAHFERMWDTAQPTGVFAPLALTPATRSVTTSTNKNTSSPIWNDRPHHRSRRLDRVGPPMPSEAGLPSEEAFPDQHQTPPPNPASTCSRKPSRGRQLSRRRRRRRIVQERALSSAFAGWVRR
jgi:hypothetical protein